MFDHFLESSHRDDSNKWSNIGFGEEITQVESIEVDKTTLIWSSDFICILRPVIVNNNFSPLFAGPFESLICGSGSGVVAKFIIYPLDLIKKRLQIQGFQEARKPFGAFRQYSGLAHCFVTVFKEEGMIGLYKGLSPSLLKAGVVSGTIFCVYDQTCSVLSLRHR